METPRQRWRIALARSSDAPPLGGRDLMDAWEVALDRSRLPLMRVGRGRARIAFGAPLPVGMPAEQELAEILLSERYELWRVREGLTGALPDGWRLVGLDDVWLGAPSLSAMVAAADYRIELAVDGPGASAGAGSSLTSIEAGTVALMRARALPRERAKGSGVVAYDLRPLLLDVCVADAGPPVVIRARTRIHPSLGSGRPEELVAALADAVGMPLVARSVVRERVLLRDELDEATCNAAAPRSQAHDPSGSDSSVPIDRSAG
jgi:radical SAM-linked protein